MRYSSIPAPGMAVTLLSANLMSMAAQCGRLRLVTMPVYCRLFLFGSETDARQ
jgi:hypothetical protein